MVVLNTLAVTRPVGEGRDTAEFIRELGWDPLIVHTVELKSRESSEILSEFNGFLVEGSLDWLVFMSPRGVQLVLDVLNAQHGLLSSVLAATQIVAVGPKTKEAIVARGHSKVFLPENYSSTGIASFFSKFSLRGKRIALARSADADDSLAENLASRGAFVKTIPLYSGLPPADRSSVMAFLDALNKNQVKGLLFTSSLSAANLFNMTKGPIESRQVKHLLQDCLVGAIGPVTARKLQKLGVRPEIIPARYLINEAVTLIVKTYHTREKSIPAS